MAWLIAKYSAICCECDAIISIGDEFVYTRDRKYCKQCGEERGEP